MPPILQEIAELRALLAEREAELAAARAELTAPAAIEQYKAQLAKLRRMQFGRSSEKLDAEIEQLELMLEDLEEGERRGGHRRPSVRPASHGAIGGKRCAARCPITCRARRSFIIPARCVRVAAAPVSPRSARTSPRFWRRSRPGSRACPCEGRGHPPYPAEAELPLRHRGNPGIGRRAAATLVALQ